jgi:UDP-N-acetylmuramyl pentapeptide phosphotransferase/UDP-N-acetylglucosamine-1-phosphate transferase
VSANLSLGLAFVGIMAVSYAAVEVARRCALRWNHLDLPNERSTHLLPVPLGGGVVLVQLNVAGWLIFLRVHDAPSLWHIAVLVAGAATVAAVSFADDLGHVPYRTRLVLQGGAAVLFVVGYAHLSSLELPLAGTVALGAIGVPLTVLWIVGMINAFNFMDGLDGMAAGQAVAAGLGWVALGAISNHPFLIVGGALLAAASLGFLGHNWHPASVFMGDVGSTFLGYSFAVLMVIAASYDPKLALAGVLLVWPAIFDSVFTVMRRLKNGDNVFTGHREFLFHRLLLAGWSHAAVSSFYIVLPLCGAVLALTWDRGNRPIHLAAAVTVVALCVGLWALVRGQEQKHLEGPSPRGFPALPLPSGHQPEEALLLEMERA